MRPFFHAGLVMENKNFINPGRAWFGAAGSKGAKVFAPLFLKSGCFPKSDLLENNHAFASAFLPCAGESSTLPGAGESFPRSAGCA
jgi:hypothetical protein